MRNLIYGLIDPRTRLIRYVGLSATGMVRPRKHRNKTRHTGTTAASKIGKPRSAETREKLRVAKLAAPVATDPVSGRFVRKER